MAEGIFRAITAVYRRLWPMFAGFGGCRSGSTVMIFSASLPVFLAGAAIAVDLSRAITVRSAMQSAADMAAIGGAKQLTIANMTDQQVIASTRAMALASVLSSIDSTSANTAVVDVQILNSRGTVKVTVSETVSNMLGSLTGNAQQPVSVAASASLKGTTQLCVLVLDPTSPGALSMDNTAQMTAPQCSAFSNSSDPQGLKASGSAVLTSSRTCTVGGYSGNSANYIPMPLTGCPTHSDPLAGITPPAYSASSCNQNNFKANGTTSISPGTYCGGIQMAGNASVTMQPGTYVLDSDFAVKGNASLSGVNVTIYFAGSNGTFKADKNTSIDLTAAKTGPWAGILIYEDPTATAKRDFHISSDNARNLLGTIYLPQGSLTIDSSRPVADQSKYTVIVTNNLKITSSANLTLNAMYSATDVPVPNGVGPSGASIQLTQ